MVETLSPLARERGVVIQAELPGQPILVLGDRDELLRVVENLIENAVKYGESGGQVDVELGRIGASHGAQGRHVAFACRITDPGSRPSTCRA